MVCAYCARSCCTDVHNSQRLHGLDQPKQYMVCYCAECCICLQDYYGQLRENNWSLYTDFKGFVGARYDL